MGHGKCWKMTEMIFLRTTKQEIPRTNDHYFDHYFENKFSMLGHEKHQKSPGKSWNFIRSKECEPWYKYVFVYTAAHG